VGFFPINRKDHPVVWRNRALQAERALAERGEERSGNYSLNSDRAYEIFVGSSSSSGAAVNTHTALGVSAVTACVGLLADMVALLPCHLVRETDRGDVPFKNHPAAQAIERPGDLHTSFEMRQLVQTGAGLGGNGYARVHRDGAGNPGELEWLSPVDVCPQRLTGQRFITYRVNGERNLLTRYDIAHVRALSTDGIMGRSPVTMLRESIGTSIAQREASGRMISNGARFGGVIEAPAALRKDQLEDVRREWAARHEGAGNSGKTPVLWGVQFKAVGGMSARDAEFIESRRFELQEIARLYRIPPVLIGDTTAATSFGAGIEQMNLALLAYCLNPWLVNWEQSLNYTLLTTDELRAGLRFKFDREEIAAVALQAQAAFISTMRTTGVFSPNDSREWLGYSKSDAPGMDDARAPLNSSSSGTPANEPAADPKTEPAAA
jgi:HK97 family phage portal protein